MRKRTNPKHEIKNKISYQVPDIVKVAPRYILMLPLLLLTLLVPTVLHAADEHRIYTQENPLVYEDSRDLWPYVFINKKGQPDGLNVEIVTSLLNRLDIPFVIRLNSSSKSREDLRASIADLHITQRNDFTAQYGFFSSSNVSTATYSVLSHQKDARKLYTLDDLRKMNFHVHKSSLLQKYLAFQGLEYNVTPADNMEKLVLDISVADTGCIVWNTMSLKYLKTRYKLDSMVLSPIDFPQTTYCFLSKDEQLLHRLDSVFALMKSSGELHAITTRWFYPENQENNSFYTTQGINVLSVVAFLLLCFLFTFYYFHRHRVKQQLADVLQQMGLVLHANKTKVWVYFPTERKFSWMDKDGKVSKEHNSYQFSLFYKEGDFDIVNKHLTDFLDGSRTPVTFDVSGYNLADRTKLIDLEVYMLPLTDEYGKVYLVAGIQRDITHTKSQLERKRMLNNRYRTVFNTEYRSTYKFDYSGKLVELNTRALATTGAETMEEAMERNYNLHIAQLFTSEQLQTSHKLIFTAMIPAAEMGRNLPFVDVDRLSYSPFYENTPDKYYIEVEFTPILNDKGETASYILNLRDVTDVVESYHMIVKYEKRYGKILQENEVQRRRIDYSLSVSGMKLVRYMPDTHILRFVDALNSEIATVSQLEMLESTELPDLQTAFSVFRKADAYTDEELHFTLRTRLFGENGEYLTYSFELRPVYDAQHSVKEYFGISSDITSRLEAEKQLQHETLRAHETEKLKQDFLRNMTYRIRVPLIAISSGINRMAETDEAQQQSALIDELTVNASRLISLSDDTLYLSRLNAGLLSQKRQPTDFAHLFSTAFDAAVHRYRNDSVTYKADNTYDSLVLDIDPDIAMRIIRESIALAAKYSNEGTLHARYVHRRDTLSIYIENNGQGIPPTVLQHIYEPRIVGGYDVNNDSSSGLEMAIVKALLMLIGGNIDIDSKPGKGLSIEITVKI